MDIKVTIKFSKIAVKFIAFKMIKRLVITWDSDFTKLTPSEKKRLDSAIEEMKNGETIAYDAIDWN